MAGAVPSFTRQVDDEIEQREQKPAPPPGTNEPERIPKKRGRKPRPKPE